MGKRTHDLFPQPLISEGICRVWMENRQPILLKMGCLPELIIDQ
jgi:hypothetical protein